MIKKRLLNYLLVYFMAILCPHPLLIPLDFQYSTERLTLHPDMLAKKDSIIRSRMYTCDGCGLRSQVAPGKPHGYMDVCDLAQGDFAANLNGVAVLCPLCMSSFSGGTRPSDANKKHDDPSSFNVIIYPEMTQNQINQIIHMYFIASYGLLQLEMEQRGEIRRRPTIDAAGDMDIERSNPELAKKNLNEVYKKCGSLLSHIEAEGSKRSKQVLGTGSAIELSLACADMDESILKLQQRRVFSDLRVLGHDKGIEDAYKHWYAAFSRMSPPETWL